MANTEPEVKKQKLDSSEKAVDLNSTQEITQGLALVEAIEDKIHNLENEKADQVLTIEKAYDIKQEPLYEKRAAIIATLPNFWTTCFLQHPQLSSLIEEEDEKVMTKLEAIRIETSKEPILVENTGSDKKRFDYKIIFKFAENDYFENTELWKAYYRVGEETVSENNKINWKEGKKLTKAENGSGDAGMISLEEPTSFFCWFEDHEDTANDEVADTIKDDLYMNSLNYYLNQEEEEDEDENGEIDLDEEDDDDDDDEDGEKNGEAEME